MDIQCLLYLQNSLFIKNTTKIHIVGFCININKLRVDWSESNLHDILIRRQQKYDDVHNKLLQCKWKITEITNVISYVYPM